MIGCTMSMKVRQAEAVLGDRGADVERERQGYAEAPGDGEQRDGGTELDVQVGPAVALERVDEGVHGAVDPLLNPPPRLFGDEGRATSVR